MTADKQIAEVRQANLRDWINDGESFVLACSVCGKDFTGHKWRVVCRSCAAPKNDELLALLIEARGHLRGYSMSMLSRTRESLITAIDYAIERSGK